MTAKNPTGKGGFQPGKSGNPGGRPKAIVEVVTLAREHTVLAFTTLARIAGDELAPPAAQVAASQALLDRGWGKPLQTMEIKRPLAGMSDDELVDAIGFIRTAIAGAASVPADGGHEEGSGKPH